MSIAPFDRAEHDPNVGWGSVCIKGTGIGVWVVASRFVAGDTIQMIADDYSVPQSDIEEAIRLFMAALPGRRGNKVEITMRKLIGKL
jgi:uncharacterized protein (DUF433 family)